MGLLTERDHELLAMPAIQSQMPVVFKNGAAWTEFQCSCRGCGRRHPEQSVRGLVSRPLERVAVIEAVAICEPCRMLTRFLYRLHDDMRMTGPRDGQWLTWKATPRSGFARLIAMIRRQFH